MKKALSIALAASLAVSAIAVSAAPASARSWHHRNNSGIAVFGAIAGLAALAAINQNRYYDYDYGYGGYGYGYGYPPPPYYGYRTHYYGGYSQHAAWCMSHFRSYNPATGIYFRAPGVPARC